MIYKKIDLHCAVFCNVSDEMAQEYIDYRIAKKKPLTQGAFNRAMNQAAKCSSCTPCEAIQLTIDKGWDGVTIEYIEAELSRRFEASSKSTQVTTRTRTLEEQLSDRSWALN